MALKAILTTVHSGFNYGSSLQALAGKTIIEKTGCICELVKLKSLVKGRDVRLRKLMAIFIRSIFLSQKTSLKAYRASYKNPAQNRARSAWRGCSGSPGSSFSPRSSGSLWTEYR